MSQLQPRFRQQLDHDWKVVRAMVREMPSGALAQLQQMLSGSSARDLADAMVLDRRVARAVRHLALLALEQAAADLFEQTSDPHPHPHPQDPHAAKDCSAPAPQVEGASR